VRRPAAGCVCGVAGRGSTEHDAEINEHDAKMDEHDAKMDEHDTEDDGDGEEGNLEGSDLDREEDAEGGMALDQNHIFPSLV